MKKMMKILQEFLGLRKIWAIIFIFFCISAYLFAIGTGMPLILMLIIIVLLLISTILRVYSFGGNSKTFCWIILPPVFVIACLLLKERSGDDQTSANVKIKNVFVGSAFVILSITIALVSFFGKWEDRQREAVENTPSKTNSDHLSLPTYDECYKNGVEYFAEIGVLILTSPPDQGRFATDVAKERCRKSTLAFGR